jgi:hypothetical protein
MVKPQALSWRGGESQIKGRDWEDPRYRIKSKQLQLECLFCFIITNINRFGKGESQVVVTKLLGSV